jgi:hypothetical protein
MAITSAQVSVTAATILADRATGPNSIVVKNPSTSTASVYVGPSGVATNTGLELAPGESVGLDLGLNDQLYAIAASGTQTVHTLRRS